MSANNNSNPVTGLGVPTTKPELSSKQVTINFSKIPTTEEELAATRFPNNEELDPAIRSEAFDLGG